MTKNKGEKLTMTKFEMNNEMELLLQARKNQPELFAQLSPATKMALGIYIGDKARAGKQELSADERLKLAGLKESIARDVLSPQERTRTALEILKLEKRR